MPTINISQALRERDESLKNTGVFSESRAPAPNVNISGALAERERRAEKPRENAFLERAPQAQNAAARIRSKSNADKLQSLFAGENLRSGENAGGLQMPKGLQNYPSINQDYARSLMSRGGGSPSAGSMSYPAGSQAQLKAAQREAQRDGTVTKADQWSGPFRFPRRHSQSSRGDCPGTIVPVPAVSGSEGSNV